MTHGTARFATMAITTLDTITSAITTATAIIDIITLEDVQCLTSTDKEV